MFVASGFSLHNWSSTEKMQGRVSFQAEQCIGCQLMSCQKRSGCHQASSLLLSGKAFCLVMLPKLQDLSCICAVSITAQNLLSWSICVPSWSICVPKHRTYLIQYPYYFMQCQTIIWCHQAVQYDRGSAEMVHWSVPWHSCSKGAAPRPFDTRCQSPTPGPTKLLPRQQNGSLPGCPAVTCLHLLWLGRSQDGNECFGPSFSAHAGTTSYTRHCRVLQSAHIATM